MTQVYESTVVELNDWRETCRDAEKYPSARSFRIRSSTSEEVAKFINVLMTGGKKSVAERIIYGALDADQKEERQGPA